MTEVFCLAVIVIPLFFIASGDGFRAFGRTLGNQLRPAYWDTKAEREAYLCALERLHSCHSVRNLTLLMLRQSKDDDETTKLRYSLDWANALLVHAAAAADSRLERLTRRGIEESAREILTPENWNKITAAKLADFLRLEQSRVCEGTLDILEHHDRMRRRFGYMNIKPV